jgi:hypothetical protein
VAYREPTHPHPVIDFLLDVLRPPSDASTLANSLRKLFGTHPRIVSERTRSAANSAYEKERKEKEREKKRRRKGKKKRRRELRKLRKLRTRRR